MLFGLGEEGEPKAGPGEPDGQTRMNQAPDQGQTIEADPEPTFAPWSPDPDRPGVAVLMSGGVDSSVSALLLQEAGWNVVGVTMRVPMAESCNHPRPCCGAEAAFVCRHIGIPHYYVDVSEGFERWVIGPFRRHYDEGRTPNPCVDCNTYVKFRLVWDWVTRRLGIGDLATGHYARVVRGRGEVFLTRADHVEKDQSYFLYGIPRSRLAGLHFPLGTYRKDVVRQKARSRALPTAEQAESMELCFAGEGDYRNALADGVGRPGPVVDTHGQILGQHRGVQHYTVGQRRGLEIPAPHPLYVLRIDPLENTIVVGPREAANRLEVTAVRTNELRPEACKPGTTLFGMIRSGATGQPCSITDVGPEHLRVRFESPVFAPAPGQHLVLYDQDGRVVAGGVITADPKDD